MNEQSIIMIGSTARDLPVYRAQVMDACLQVNMSPKMMEHMPALDSDAITASLELVDEADVYIGIFAHRYGYIPDGRDKSLTEMEYERAVERGIPQLIFLMSDDVPVLPKDVDKGDSAIKLDDLKERLKKEHVVKFFKNPEDLRGLTLLSLSKVNKQNVAVEGVRDQKAINDSILDEIKEIRNSLRALLTVLMAKYYETDLDKNDRQIIPENTSVLSKSHFLVDKPFKLKEKKDWLKWNPVKAPIKKFEPLPEIKDILQTEKQKESSYNGFLYRFLGGNDQTLEFCPGSYFKFLDSCEYLSYELANALLNHTTYLRMVVEGNADDLEKVASFLKENEEIIPIRAKTDPFDFASRCTAFGTCTLVLIKRTGKSDQFILNERSDILDETPGLQHVIPAGTFQQIQMDKVFKEKEFSFSENIFREFIEELLEDKNLRGNGPPAISSHEDSYEEKGRRFRKIIVKENKYELFYLGLVIDPINLKPEILTVMIIHEGFLRSVSDKFIESPLETKRGTLTWFDFNESTLNELINNISLVPTGKAHLIQVLKHFNFLHSELKNI